VATCGLVCVWHNDLDDKFEEQIIAGLSLEMVERLKRRDAVEVRERNPDARYVLNTEELTIELDELVRETRRFRAEHQLTEKEVLHGVRFPDAIANGTYRVDIHYPEGGGHIFRYLDGREVSIRHNERNWSRWRPEGDETALFYQIPYRSMVRRDCPNLIMAGRMIDADPGAYGAIRVMITMNQTGEAAGEAAALALDGTATWQVDPAILRERLQDGGSIVK
jgi:hypothetical protein